MKGQKFILIAVLIALVVATGAFTSVMAADDDNTLSVVNKTNRDIQVELYSRGDIAYGVHDTDDPGIIKIFIVPAGGSNDVLLDKDEVYWYKYGVCGDVHDGQIDMENDVKIVINPCDRQPTTLEVRNHTGNTITLRLIGSEEKEYDIKPGLNRINVNSGETIYSYDACDPVQDFSGEIDILATGRSDLLMRSCEYYLSLVFEYGAANVVSFRIINYASFPVILSVIGPMNDLIELSPGENRVTLVVGSYAYSYYMDYQLVPGNFFVPPNGNGALLLSPSFTIDNGLFEEEFE